MFFLPTGLHRFGAVGPVGSDTFDGLIPVMHGLTKRNRSPDSQGRRCFQHYNPAHTGHIDAPGYSTGHLPCSFDHHYEFTELNFKALQTELIYGLSRQAAAPTIDGLMWEWLSATIGFRMIA
jgi:hypothetical protein